MVVPTPPQPGSDGAGPNEAGSGCAQPSGSYPGGAGATGSWDVTVAGSGRTRRGEGGARRGEGAATAAGLLSSGAGNADPSVTDHIRIWPMADGQCRSARGHPRASDTAPIGGICFLFFKIDLGRPSNWMVHINIKFSFLKNKQIWTVLLIGWPRSKKSFLLKKSKSRPSFSSNDQDQN